MKSLARLMASWEAWALPLLGVSGLFHEIWIHEGSPRELLIVACLGLIGAPLPLLADRRREAGEDSSRSPSDTDTQ